MLPSRLSTQISTLYSNNVPDSTICGCKFYRLPENSTSHYTEWANSLPPERLYLEQYRELTVLQPTWVLTRKRFDELGGYGTEYLRLEDEGERELRLGEDLRFFYKHMKEGGKVRCVCGCVCVFFVFWSEAMWATIIIVAP